MVRSSLLFAFSAAALGIVLTTASAQAGTVLAIPPSYDGLRMMLNSTTTPATAKITATTTPGGFVKTPFTLTGTGLTVSPAAGTMTSAAAKSFAFGWADTSATGAQSGQITLNPGADTMNVTGAVVANRTFTLGAIGTSGTALRVMQGTTVGTTITSATDDNDATRVNVKKSTKVDAASGVTVSWGDVSALPVVGTAAQFNGTVATSNLNVKFAKTGAYDTFALGNTPLNISSTLLANGEATSVGAVVGPANLDYNVDVLAARKLSLTTPLINFGNVLNGATVSGNFVANTTNVGAADASTTRVNVGAVGGTALNGALGALTVAQTYVAGTGSYVNVPVTGTFNAYGTVSNMATTLPVATAEDPTVNDPTHYAGLNAKYSVNVGIATLPPQNSTSNGTYSPLFTANVAAGQTTGMLSSEVNPKGTLAQDTTPASAIVHRNTTTGQGSGLKGLYGAVGSEAVIYDSTPLAADTTVGMQWRPRTSYEAGVITKTQPAPGVGTLYNNNDWLTSDVVKITGIGAGVTYALQMSFDDRINLANDGPTTGTIANEFVDLAIAELSPAGKWQQATDLALTGAHATKGVHGSLATFLAAETKPVSDGGPGYSLADLQGSWGVDDNPADVTATGRAESWAIVAGGGSGTFAVLPEPSSIVLVLMSAAVGLAYSIRRRLQK